MAKALSCVAAVCALLVCCQASPVLNAGGQKLFAKSGLTPEEMEADTSTLHTPPLAAPAATGVDNRVGEADPPKAEESKKKVETPSPGGDPANLLVEPAQPQPATDNVMEKKIDSSAVAAAQAPQQQAAENHETQMMDLAIVIPTVRRFQKDGNPAPEQYLAPMVDKMWNDLSKEEQQHVHIYILNSDKEPEKHVEARSLESHAGVTVFNKADHKQDVVRSMNGVGELEDGRQVSDQWLGWVASENMDASFLFDQVKSKVPYILFLEDDVLPTTQALRKLSNFVQGFQHDDWLFLDLYTPNLDWRSGMLDVVNGEKYPFECCTQAMLFKTDRVDPLIGYWRDHAGEPIDDNLRNFMKDTAPNLSVYAVRPNLFEHVGAYSSNAEKSTGVVEHTSLDFVP